ncbi:hypothetical protein [Streptomyces sp. MK7]|uniref:coiled-coil domain-containing protein n=1 Tax=Streptomyces sp. MK7 TaxID=3067635 RepID=UPI00292EBEBF|nr:hypothetical protein [Streptomyces sp. MK7]
MSSVVEPGGEARRRAEFWGSASEDGHVYQSKGSQFIAHLHLYGSADGSEDSLARAVSRGEALEYMQGRVNQLIRGLRTTQAEWAARVAELEEKAERARAEGREQALTEVQEQLQNAELRVIKAQQMMREAVQEREKTETLLAQAQAELAQRRRAEEQRQREEEEARDQIQEQARSDPSADAVPGEDPLDTVALREEGEQYSEFLERVEAELGAMRDDLRLLGEGLPGQNGGGAVPDVLLGEWVRKPDAEATPTGKATAPTDEVSEALINKLAGALDGKQSQAAGDSGGAGAAPTSARRRTREKDVPGPPRYFRIILLWIVCPGVQPWIPALLVTSNRAAYGSHPAVWEAVLFTFVTSLLGALLCALTVLVAIGTMVDRLDRTSEDTAGCLLFLAIPLAAILGLVASFWTPLTWPGPAGTWGHGIASLVGMG